MNNDRIQTGMVVIADVYNPFENPNSTGKGRPCIVVERQGGQVLIVGLTSKRTFRNGGARIAVPDPSALGLHGPGHLWSDRWYRVSAIDVGEVIGWVTPEAAELVIGNVRVNPRQAHALRAAAHDHHDPLPTAA